VVKHLKHMKRSSISADRRPELFAFPCYVECFGRVAKDLEIVQEATPAKCGRSQDCRYFITGALQDDFVGSARWKELAHVAFANLRVDDPRSVTGFLKQYGLLLARPMAKVFEIHHVDLADAQRTLTAAWSGEPVTFTAMEGVVEENVNAAVLLSEGYVRLAIQNLWATICFLFLKDFQAGKIVVCGNPDCPAPYFVAKRRTQKFCESGACTDYAHRQYALKWWNAEGKARRELQAKDGARKGKKR
jgi:hypothetical protein